MADDRRNKFRKFARKADTAINRGRWAMPMIFGLLLLVILFRFYMLDNYQDAFFQSYKDDSGLMYFDVFGWFKGIAQSFGNLGSGFNETIATFGSFPTQVDAISMFFNAWILIFNAIWFIVKVILFIPLMLVGIIFGGFFFEWTKEGGWVNACLHFNIPYVDIGAWFRQIGDFLNQWWQGVWAGITTWFSGSFWTALFDFFSNTIPNWFASWWPF